MKFTFDSRVRRRSFPTATGATLGAVLAGHPLAHCAGAASSPDAQPNRPKPRWFENAWRRAVIDLHIPDWRIIHPNGGAFGENSRRGFVCPNSPYRGYVRAWARELAERYDCERVRFDMTFWTCVCYCAHCQERWRKEVGGEMPRTVDWTDERRVRLQRKREQRLGEFAFEP
jgi:hypothetical protein